MLTQLFIGCLLILATTVIHGVFTGAGVGYLRRKFLKEGNVKSNWHATLIVSGFVLWLFLAMVVEVWLWAAVYLFIGAIGTLETALYFSTVTMTTLGYGDVVLDPSWRLLASFEAANGLFLFGWSTALVFAVVQWIYKEREIHQTRA